MRTLVIIAHPALHRSRINAHLSHVAHDLPAVTTVDLYDSYPDFEIDVAQEQTRLLAADAVILQHPMYWYATPALLKEWVDLVFEHGFAYGDGTKKLAGKVLAQAVSTGGDAQAFAADGFNRFSITELLRPMEATAHFCAMQWRPPFLTQGGHVIDDDDIHAAGERYRDWLTAFTDETPAQAEHD